VNTTDFCFLFCKINFLILFFFLSLTNNIHSNKPKVNYIHWLIELSIICIYQSLLCFISSSLRDTPILRGLTGINLEISNKNKMCTYHGIIEEYPLISIDSFETHNYTSTMFFITHIHMDHLVGLERPEFGKYVAKINAPIYMSDISKQLLSTMAPYRHLIPYFKSVPIDQPFALTIQSNDPVQAKKKDGASIRTTLASHTPDVGEPILVTCFGSGHCPGSMMIWIEGEHGNVLFTGDFRLYRGQAKRITHLQRRGGEHDDEKEFLFKPIENLYIDMTFFRPDILHIPTREVSCEALILWIKGLVADQSNTANIYFKTRFLFRKFNCQILFFFQS